MEQTTLFDVPPIVKAGPTRTMPGRSKGPYMAYARVKIVYENPAKYITGQRKRISGSRDAFEILHPGWDGLEHHEAFYIIPLNRANEVIADPILISTGAIAGTVCDPRIIFQYLLVIGACSFIAAHNHPSGSMVASQADIELTKKLQAAGQVLQIMLLDHVIINGRIGSTSQPIVQYFSFADEGLLINP